METTKPSIVKSESEEDQKLQNETTEIGSDTPPLESTDMLQDLKKCKQDQENLQEEILVSDSSIEEDEEQMKEESL